MQENERSCRTRSAVPVASGCIGLVVAMTLLWACGGGGDDDGLTSDMCRFEPENCSEGRAGAFCERDADCQGICCTDDGNCAGGMCTFGCRDDRDCPVDMACEHDVCFYTCRDDLDCAQGMSCEHGGTICEWP
ncbi:MAG: hypothetical protein OEZ06_11305 [Myxococcales bacterium]|nr:hypothetical protein [Myxococcales bacterium]